MIGAYELRPIGWVESPLRDRENAPSHALSARPRGDPANPERGVFSTRSPDRPNPIGLHRVQVVSIDGTWIRVRNLEALNGTPILDLKPTLDRSLEL